MGGPRRRDPQEPLRPLGWSSTDVFAAGARGTLLHFDGASWAKVSVPTEYLQSFESVRGTSRDHVFFVGDSGKILRYDGTRWSLEHNAGRYLMDVWGSSANDVFAAGYTVNGTAGVLHFDGTSWSEIPLPKVRPVIALWGSGPSNVFAVGGTGTVYAFDGSSWSVEYSRHGISLLGVWGRGPDDVYAVGSTGAILHYGAQ